MREKTGKSAFKVIASLLAAGMFLNSVTVVKADPLSLNSIVNKTTNKINNNDYAVIETPMNWLDAKAYAESIGAHLATITTKEEQDFVANLIKSAPSTNYWIGGSDEAVEGDYKWANGEAFSYSNWGVTEPNNYYGYHSENQISVDKATGQWIDSKGQTALFPFICEWDSKDNYQSLDYNKDSAVDVSDVSVISKYYNTNNLTYDLNGDGKVDIFDLIVISKSIDAKYSANNGVAFGNTSTNLMQGGYAAQSFNTIYYRNDSDSSRLYKSNIDGTSRVKLSDDSVRSINAAGNWIYYKNDSDSGKLYKIKNDGSSRTKLMDDISPYYMLEGGFIYYINGNDGNCPYRIDINGLNKAKLSTDAVYSLAAGNNSVFYQAKLDGKLYRIDNNGLNKKLIINGTVAKYFVSNGLVYFINTADGNVIYKIGINGDNVQKLGADAANSIYMSDNYIYYTKPDGSINRMKLDGSQGLRIGSDFIDTANSTSIVNVVQDWVFYSNKNDSNKVYKIKADGSGKKIIDPFKVYQDSTVLGEFNSQEEAISFASSKNMEHIKVISPMGVLLWHNYPEYGVMTGNILMSEYPAGRMFDAINYARTFKGGKVVRLNPSNPGQDMIWDENLYRVYQGENLVDSKAAVKDAILVARLSSPRRIIDPAGQTVWNSETNLKGYATVDEYLNIRSAPSTASAILGKVYAFTKLEIVETTSGWYKVVYGDGFGYVSTSYVKQYTSPIESIVSIGRNITKDFEGSGFTEVTGNFDGQGMSVGYLQWCLGQGSLQPLFYRVDNEFNPITRQAFGTNYDSFHNMLGMATISEQVAWAASINDSSNRIVDPWKTQLVNLCKTTEFQNIQKDAEIQTTSRAMTIIYKYNLKTVRGFALAFDIANQNGSIKSSVAAVIDSAIAAKPTMTEKELLGVIANAVADGSVYWSDDVRARKMAIVNGTGYVHGKTFYLDRDYGLNDNPWQ